MDNVVTNAGMLAALKAARQFIVNGTELGYICMPETGTPDPAHDTLPMIERAIADLEAVKPVGFLHKRFRESQHRQAGVIFWDEESLFSIPVYLGAPMQAAGAESERDQGIPGTSFQRLNQLANQGE